MVRRFSRWATPLIPALCLGLSACIGPSDQRPGFALIGIAVEELPSNWSFTDAYPEIALQVETPYGLPHSVTIWCASLEGDLYVGARDPLTKSWPGWVDRNPNVRLKIGTDLYDVRLAPLEDQGRIAALREVYAKKYALSTPASGQAPSIRYWKVVPRS